MNMNDRLNRGSNNNCLFNVFSGCTSESGDGIENDSDGISDIPELDRQKMFWK